MIEAIHSEHPEFAAQRAIWKKYRDLYVGGEQLRQNAGDYLIRRQKETASVYAERLNRVFYENYIGSIVDWYVATLFRREPVIVLEGDDRRGREFIAELSEDCDRRGTTITEFFRRQMLEALVCGVSYVLVDFPRAARRPETLAEEDLEGTGRAYLSGCAADQLVNWSTDSRGEFEWVVIRLTSLTKKSPADSVWLRETRWLYYDRKDFAVYRRLEGAGASGAVELLDSGVHPFSKIGKVPLYALRVPEGMWLLNKAGSLQIEHLNKSNALSWALTMGLFAQPVVYTEKAWNQIVGESYYLQLSPGDRFGWTEPEGHVFQIAADNLNRLKEEIYRVTYLMSQAGGSLVNQSGVSKQRDFAITQEVLRTYGDIAKDTIKRVLRGILAVREDALKVDVSGLDEFDIGDFSGELADAEKLLALAPGSATLKQQVFKKLAFKYLCDIRQELKDRIANEIDEAMEAAK